MPKFSIIDVKVIHSEVSRSTFSESDIERLADAILANDGLLQPLILKQTDVASASFLVVEGHFEFYGAVRAREKNPRKGSMVNAFVLPFPPSSSEEATILEQIDLLRKQVKPPDPDLTTLITNVETRLSKKLEDVLQNQQKIELRLQQIDEKIPERTLPPPRINLSTATREEIKSGLDYLNNRPVNSLGLSAEKFANALDRIDGAAHRQYWSETLKEVPALRCGITTAKLPIFKEVFYSTPALIPPDTTDSALLNTLSVAQLKKLAQERGKTGTSKMTKKDWVNLLSQP